jgi:hypothetical protein
MSVLVNSFIGGSLGDDLGSGDGYASAYLDPRIEIDPDYLALHPNISLTYSDGVGNFAGSGLDDVPERFRPNQPIGGVPEPSEWALIVVGLGFAGASLRRIRGYQPRTSMT